MIHETVELTETELSEVARFVRLVENLTSEALLAVDINALPMRDRTYVKRLRILATEDAHLIHRQRVVWLKLQHGICLLQSEARELLEVLGCRGFYFSGLNLDGMVFTTLDMSGGMIGGDYSCQYTRVLGLCDERGLIVVGRYLSRHRCVQGKLAADGLSVLGRTAATQAPSQPDSDCIGGCSHPSQTRGDLAQSPDTASDVSGIEELLDDDFIDSIVPPPSDSESTQTRGDVAQSLEAASDAASIQELLDEDIIESLVPPREPNGTRRSGRSLFPSSVAPGAPATAARRYSLAPRAGSPRVSRPPRMRVQQRSLRTTLPPIGALASPRIHLNREVSPDTSEVDVAWE